MTMKKMLAVLIIIASFLFAMTVSADYEAVSSPVIGSWMLDKVYENSSSAERYVLDPENAGSLYAEQENIYAFLAGGAAEMTMEGVTQFGYWEKKDDGFLMVISSTGMDPDGDAAAVPDIDPLFETLYFYDEEQNVLHRYWKDDDPEAYYHDLDFVYKKIPQGVWMMTKVYSGEQGKEPQLLDPESSQSMYAESVNRLFLYRDDVNEMIPAETEFLNVTGKMKKAGDNWLLVFEDGFEMQLYYDDSAAVLHRFFREDTADAVYLDIDFVYEMIPVGAWHLDSVFDIAPDGDPVLIEEEQEPELYRETLTGFSFGPDGSASADTPDEAYGEGRWERDNERILLHFDEGEETVFVYDAKTDVLHRYQQIDDPDSAHHLLDFVYLIC